MSEVDLAQADAKARALADEVVRASFWPQDRQCMDAMLLWKREYSRQYHAFTQPGPPPKDPK